MAAMRGTCLWSCVLAWSLISVISVINVQARQASNHVNSICSTWGREHFKTFDGDVYQFPGMCEYNLVSDCHESYREFSVHLKRTEAGDPTVSYVTITINDVLFHLTNNSVTVNGRSIKGMYYDAAVLVEQNAVYIKLQAKVGVTVMWNRDDAVMVELDSTYASRTCGLCGDFNGVAVYNEFIHKGRKITPIEFGNRQKVHRPNDDCEDPYEEDDDYAATTLDTCKEFRSACDSKLRSESWSSCNTLLSPEPYIQACVQDMCGCTNGTDDLCVCSTLSEYSRQCSHAGGQPPNWRTPEFCAKQCPFNMVYEESGSPCMDSCTLSDTSSLCEDHKMDGCFCPAGTVFDDISKRGCIPQSECQCKHDKIYNTGEVYRQDTQECTCYEGRWSCKILSSPATCAVEEGSHVTTFDGQTYTFHGDCYYTLAKVESKDEASQKFTLLVQLVPCTIYEFDTCLKTLKVLLNNNRNNILEFTADGKVRHNMQIISLPYHTGDINIFQASSFHILFQTSFGLQVQIQHEPIMQIYMTLEQSYRGKTRGLCGNYNMVQLDDMKTPQGMVEGTPSAFGNSWKSNLICEDREERLDDPCSLSVENEIYAEHWCSLLRTPKGDFAPCHAVVDPETYYKRCVYASCNCDKSEACMCAVFSSYTRACASKGVFLTDWRENVCGKYTRDCPASQTYFYKLQRCQLTCRSLGSTQPSCTSDFLPVDGCSCPEGQYLDDNALCVPMAKCPCYHNGGHVKPGKSINIKDEHCVCTNGKLHCRSWRPRSLACPPPKVFFNCSTAGTGELGVQCAPTCAYLDSDVCSTAECESGCQCPSGLVDDGKDYCVKEHECPCQHNGHLYAPGSQVPDQCNTCTCKSGKWECTDTKCAGTCVIYGTGHYSSFDQRSYGFRGNCSYVAVQNKCGNKTVKDNFRVITENSRCGSAGTTCSKSVRIQLGRTELKLLNGKHETVDLGHGTQMKYTIRTVGLYLVIEAANGLSVLWDRKTTIRIILKPQHSGDVCGLCGDFDGDSKNDFTTQGQLVVGSPLEFANSWKVSSNCPDAEANDEKCGDDRHNWAKLQCHIIKGVTFQDCHKKVLPGPFYENCVEDSCACDTGGDCECLCTAVAAYAQACNEAGVCVAWRTPEMCRSTTTESTTTPTVPTTTTTPTVPTTTTTPTVPTTTTTPTVPTTTTTPTVPTTTTTEPTTTTVTTTTPPPPTTTTTTTGSTTTKSTTTPTVPTTTTEEPTTTTVTTTTPPPPPTTTTGSTTTESTTTPTVPTTTTTPTVPTTTTTPTVPTTTTTEPTTTTVTTTTPPTTTTTTGSTTTESTTTPTVPTTTTTPTVPTTTTTTTVTTTTLPPTTTTGSTTTESTTTPTVPTTTTTPTVPTTTTTPTVPTTTTTPTVPTTTTTPTVPTTTTTEPTTTTVTTTTPPPPTTTTTTTANHYYCDNNHSTTNNNNIRQYNNKVYNHTNCPHNYNHTNCPHNYNHTNCPHNYNHTNCPHNYNHTNCPHNNIHYYCDNNHSTNNNRKSSPDVTPPVLPGDTILNRVHIGSGVCLTMTCSAICEIQNKTAPCPSTTTPTTTPTTIPTTTPHVPTCPEWDVVQNETFWLCECLMARCIEDNIIEIIPYVCPTIEPITCLNGKKPLLLNETGTCCPRYVCDCACEGWGDPHYITFDGLFYSYQGNCTYVLMEEKKKTFDLTIYIDNVFCDPNEDVSCPRSIIVHYKSDVITLRNNNLIGAAQLEALKDGVTLKLPYIHNGIRIQNSGINMVLEIPHLEVVVTFGITGFSVNLPYKYFGNNTQGHCGTCNNNQADDCMLPGGQLLKNCAVMADYWPANHINKPDCPIPVLPTNTPVAPPTQTPCGTDSMCDLLKSSVFEPCHPFVNPDKFYQGCVFDSCHVSNPAVECTSLQAYSAACAQAGVCLYWRNYTTLCESNCPQDKVYKPCGPAEQPTCEDNPNDDTMNFTTEGCFCPDGMKLFNKESSMCVDKCGCLDSEGIPREFNERFEYKCQNCICEESTKAVTCKPKACPVPPEESCTTPGFIIVNQTIPSNPCCSLYVCQCDIRTCPAIDMNCPVGYKPQVTVPEGKCCPERICDPKAVCVHKNIEYELGASLPIMACQKCICSREEDPKTKLFKIKCEFLQCEETCEEGYEYVQTKQVDECCGRCVQTHCIFNIDGTKKILTQGQVWSPPGNKCKYYTCIKTGGTFATDSSDILCPPFEQSNCQPVSVEKEKGCKLGSMRTQISHKGCQSIQEVDIPYCEGSCNTFTKYSQMAAGMQHSCSCCKESRASNRTVDLLCLNGQMVPHTYIHVEECSCGNADCTTPVGFPTRKRRSFTLV
ncbi:mucin-5B [Diretmus argenteus]